MCSLPRRPLTATPVPTCDGQKMRANTRLMKFRGGPDARRHALCVIRLHADRADARVRPLEEAGAHHLASHVKPPAQRRARMQFTQGSRIGVYEVIALVAIGGTGEVYRARDTRLGRDVALKILTEIAVGDPEHQARFERE